jgi:ribonuclease P protein component
VLRNSYKTKSQTTHFAIHHLLESPFAFTKVFASSMCLEKLSTDISPNLVISVDDSGSQTNLVQPLGIWLGLVVPKRHARRAVTRNLIKRQIRTVVADVHESGF